MNPFKRHTAAAVAAAAILGFGSGAAEAAPILVSDTFDWAGPGAGTTFTEPALPSWTHNLTFDPEATSFNYAELDLRHVGNRANENQEVWFLSSMGDVFIGNLSPSANSASLGSAVIDTFTIPSTLYPIFPTGSWTLALKLGDENTGTTNSITLDYATLRVSYEAASTGGGTTIPEPASLLLFGMAGLAARRVVRRAN